MGTTKATKSMGEEYYALRKQLSEKAFSTVRNAAGFAAVLHEGQWRRAAAGIPKSPYINHPLRVAQLLADNGARSAIVATALLHDTVEDCSKRFAELFLGVEPSTLTEEERRHRMVRHIAEQYGANIAETVSLLSLPESKYTGNAKQGGCSQITADAAAHAEYAEHVSNAVNGNTAALVVKFSDWIDNSAGVAELIDAESNPQRLMKLRKQAAKYLSVADVLRSAERELTQHVRDPGAFTVFMESKLDETQQLLEELVAG